MIDNVKSFFSNVAKGLGRKSRTFRMFMSALNVQPSFTNADYIDYVEEAFQQNPYVYSVITQIANSCAGIPPALYEVNDTGEVARAVSQFEKKGHSPRRKMRMKRQVIENVRRSVAKKYVLNYGTPYHVGKMLATKALVQSGELERIDGHELLDLLLYPNDWYQRSYQQFIQSWVMHLEIGGMNFIEPIGPETRNAPPRQIYALPPKHVQFVKGTEGHPIRGFKFSGRRGRMFRYDPNPMETEIFYSRYYNPLNPLRGMSPAYAARFSIDVNNEGRRWNLGLLQNGAAHSGIISAKGQLGKKQVDDIKKKFNQKHAGASNAGKILALDELEGVEFTPVTQTAKDMQWGDLNRITALECAIVWNTPPEIIGNTEQKTFSNYKEAREAFYKEKVIPTMDFVYGELNTSIVPLFEQQGSRSLWLDYDAEKVEALRDDVNDLHERVREDVNSSLLMINEGREAIGWESMEGGDLILVDSRQVPLATVAQSDTGEPLPEEEEEEEEQNAKIRERAAKLLMQEEQDEGPRFFPNGH